MYNEQETTPSLFFAWLSTLLLLWLLVAVALIFDNGFTARARLDTAGRKQGLSALKGGSQGGVLDSKLIYQGATFFPPTVGLIGGRESCIEQLRAGF
jgi:hypothetical protein